jgi:hypothetical protein
MRFWALSTLLQLPGAYRPTLFERRVAYRWWQGLGRYSLRVMEAAAQAKRHAEEQGGNNEFMSMHSETPVSRPMKPMG